MGAFVEWRSYYSVGDPSLDAEHQQILGLIDDLYATMSAGKENAKTREILDRLVRYTLTHFEHEEQIMRDCDFPGLAVHKAEHSRMKQRTLDLREHIGLVTGKDVLYFLKDWWTNHIQEEDKSYSAYLRAAVH
jgi:hemerythrin-like metal-binding protein